MSLFSTLTDFSIDKEKFNEPQAQEDLHEIKRRVKSLLKNYVQASNTPADDVLFDGVIERLFPDGTLTFEAHPVMEAGVEANPFLSMLLKTFLERAIPAILDLLKR